MGKADGDLDEMSSIAGNTLGESVGSQRPRTFPPAPLGSREEVNTGVVNEERGQVKEFMDPGGEGEEQGEAGRKGVEVEGQEEGEEKSGRVVGGGAEVVEIAGGGINDLGQPSVASELTG